MIKHMTARRIIEARLGRKLPLAKDMHPYERKAVLALGLQLLRLENGKA